LGVITVSRGWLGSPKELDRGRGHSGFMRGEGVLFLRTGKRRALPFMMQCLLPSVVVLGCGFSFAACGFVRTFD